MVIQILFSLRIANDDYGDGGVLFPIDGALYYQKETEKYLKIQTMLSRELIVREQSLNKEEDRDHLLS